MLQRFSDELIAIGATKGWKAMSSAEREHLLRYRRSDGPFSLMFCACLDKHGITGG